MNLVIIILLGVIVDSTEDENFRWHVAGFSYRFKKAEKTINANKNVAYSGHMTAVAC
jgi:hypothetical protein